MDDLCIFPKIPSFFLKNCVVKIGGVGGDQLEPDLLHEEVDVHLCIVHDKAMRPFDPHQSFVHGLTVDVDPTGCSRGQEISR